MPPLDDDAVVRLEQLPGVAAAYPDIRVRGVKVRFGQRAESGLAIGIPREASLFGVAEEILVAGSFFGEEKKPEAILGIQLVHGLGFDRASDAVGIQLTLESAGLTATDSESFTFQRKQLVVTVVGVYNVPAILPGVARQGILLPVELMKQLPGTRVESALSRLKAGATPSMSGYSSVTVRVRHPSDLEPVARQIDALGYRTSTMLGRLREMRSFLILLQILLAAVGSVALVVAALGIVNTLLMAVLERYQEIGIYKAIGASDGDVFVLFVTEAAVIGLLGSLGGLVLGRLVSWGLGLGIGLYAPARVRRKGSICSPFPYGCWEAPSPFPSSSVCWPGFIRRCAPRVSIRFVHCVGSRQRPRTYPSAAATTQRSQRIWERPMVLGSALRTPPSAGNFLIPN